MIGQLMEALEKRNLEVSEMDGTLNVAQGSGIMAHKTNLDPASFLASLDGLEDAQQRRKIAGYANGVKTVLLEPKRSKAREWSFVESAGSLLPSFEVDTFVDGVRDASGETAWVEPLEGDIVVAWIMRLNRGLRPVTVPQFEEWGVTEDRLRAAGRSLLFHRTRGADWEPHGEIEHVRELRVGDGHDAARMIVAEDVYFVDVDRNWRFAFPEPDLLLAVDDSAEAGALREAARSVFAESDYPLSTDVWRMTKSGPVRDGVS